MTNIENGDGKEDKPEHEAKDDAAHDPAHGGQGESTGLGAGHLQGVEVFTGKVDMALTILSLVMVIVPPQLSLLSSVLFTTSSLTKVTPHTSEIKDFLPVYDNSIGDPVTHKDKGKYIGSDIAI